MTGGRKISEAKEICPRVFCQNIENEFTIMPIFVVLTKNHEYEPRFFLTKRLRWGNSSLSKKFRSLAIEWGEWKIMK